MDTTGIISNDELTAEFAWELVEKRHCDGYGGGVVVGRLMEALAPPPRGHIQGQPGRDVQAEGKCPVCQPPPPGVRGCYNVFASQQSRVALKKCSAKGQFLNELGPRKMVKGGFLRGFSPQSGNNPPQLALDRFLNSRVPTRPSLAASGTHPPAPHPPGVDEGPASTCFSSQQIFPAGWLDNPQGEV